jgi:hypothetical protein
MRPACPPQLPQVIFLKHWQPLGWLHKTLVSMTKCQGFLGQLWSASQTDQPQTLAGWLHQGMPITTAKLKRSILKCLPWKFKPHETSLSPSTATSNIPQTLATVRVVAQNIGFNDQVPRVPRAAVVRKPNG